MFQHFFRVLRAESRPIGRFITHLSHRVLFFRDGRAGFVWCGVRSGEACMEALFCPFSFFLGGRFGRLVGLMEGGLLAQ